jgi:phosphotriesterase-related protein
MIITVLGEIAASELGFCQSHEHIYISQSPVQAGGPIDDPEKSLAELEIYRSAGGSAIIDAQPIGAGRDASVLARLSEQSGVHIIASTGFHKLSYYPKDHWVFSASEEELTRLFTAEIEQGMFLDGDTDFPHRQSSVRAGQIKTALDTDGLTPPYRKLFCAAARAAQSTGCPLMVHIEQGSKPLELADFLEKEGMSTARMIFCHLDRAIPDFSIHKELCRRGIYLEYDTIGRPKYHDDNHELELILELLETGYGEKLLLGLDTTRQRLRSYGGLPGLSYILEVFIPFMQKNGISKTGINRFFMENPSRIFLLLF